MNKRTRTITRAERDELQKLIETARALNHASHLVTCWAEEIVDDANMNSHTFDAANNSDISVDELLKRLDITVAKPRKKVPAR